MPIPYAYGTENRTVRVWYVPSYRTVEVSVLGHFQPSSIAAIKDVINFTWQVSLFSKGSARNLLFKMASASISASQRIFYGRNSKEWTINPNCF